MFLFVFVLSSCDNDDVTFISSHNSNYIESSERSLFNFSQLDTIGQLHNYACSLILNNIEDIELIKSFTHDEILDYIYQEIYLIFPELTEGFQFNYFNPNLLDIKDVISFRSFIDEMDFLSNELKFHLISLVDVFYNGITFDNLKENVYDYINNSVSDLESHELLLLFSSASIFINSSELWMLQGQGGLYLQGVLFTDLEDPDIVEGFVNFRHILADKSGLLIGAVTAVAATGGAAALPIGPGGIPPASIYGLGSGIAASVSSVISSL